jgi:hypothetical protein
MNKKKKISKTEQKLRNQLRYNRSVLNKEANEIYNTLKDNNFDVNKKIGSYSIGTTIDLLNKKQLDRKNKIDKIVEKLEKRFKYKSKVFNEQKEYDDNEDFTEPIDLGNAWDVKDILLQLMGYMRYRGKAMNKVRDACIRDAMNIIVKMESKDLFYILVDNYENIILMYASN